MTDTRPDIVQLPPPKHAPPPRHRFGDPVSVPANYELDRHQQTERACTICGAVKVTVHGPGGRHWREWRLTPSGAQWEMDGGPHCSPDLSISP